MAVSKDKAIQKARNEKAKKNDDLFRDKPNYPRKKLFVSLPIAPSVNHYMGTKRNGRHYIKKSGKEFIRNATASVNLAIEQQNWMVQGRDVWMYMDLVVYMPDRIVRDSHNMLKILIDVFQGTVMDNDYYCMPRIQSVEYDKENPRIEVIVKPQLKTERNKFLTYFKKTFTKITS